jgi:hypothetical protein
VTRRELRRIALANVGPRFSADVECQNCGATGEVDYQRPPERWTCPACRRLAMIRASEAEPYPMPPPSLDYEM